MLKIKWTITNGELKPVYYELHNVDRSFAHLLTNPKYGLKTTQTNSLGRQFNTDGAAVIQGTVLYSRKIDFSGMNDGQTKTVKSIYGNYKIKAVQGMKNVPTMDPTGVLQCINWPIYTLFNFSSNRTVDTGGFTTRTKIERFLFVTNLQQLQETVHFDLQTDDTLRNKQLYEGKSIEVSINIYDTQQ
jgi:hypothetical protein